MNKIVICVVIIFVAILFRIYALSESSTITSPVLYGTEEIELITPTPEPTAEPTPSPEPTPEPTLEPTPVPKVVQIHSSRKPVMKLNEPVTLTSELSGFEGYEVQYQWLKNTGDGFKPIPGATSSSYQFNATKENLMADYRLVVYYSIKE